MPFAASRSRDTHPHAGEQGTHWDKTNNELTSFKKVISFSSLVPECP